MSGELENKKLIKKIVWASTRSSMEVDNYKHNKSGKKSKSYWSLFSSLVHYFAFILKVFNLYNKGLKNAKNIIINKIELKYKNLPENFDNYTILHLSDLHTDSIKELEDIIINKIKNLNVDVCFITGDFRKDITGSIKNIIKITKKITSNINAKDGIYAVLGNHDTYLMTDYEEELKLKFLINESVSINRGKDKITVTGTDDPYRYYTAQAKEALEKDIKGFKIALVHTSELHETAAKNNYNLYLCGHTHGGQICLPGGTPVITHQFDGKKFFKGLWKHLNMIGYTSSGCGVSGIPLRFYSQGEITIFTLKKI
ncbi:MAG: metallophosphoesterase family protein [Bacteroidales bacterium]|nr:metallophosphoesterase family protein [Bacteroidales bacterium]